MLVLSRQKDEQIVIADIVKITIVEVRGDHVRIGIAAPKQVSVHRREVWLKIQAEKQQSTAASPCRSDGSPN